MLKKLCAFISVVCLLLLVNIFVIADIQSNGNCGDNLTWSLGDNGILTISGSGDMTKFSSYTDVPWYSNRENIQSVVMDDTVTSIGCYAFAYCNNLKNIEMPKDLKNIDKFAFWDCENLTMITIPNGTTDISTGAFVLCNNLISITIPNTVTSIVVVKEGRRNRIKSRFLRQYQTML